MAGICLKVFFDHAVYITAKPVGPIFRYTLSFVYFQTLSKTQEDKTVISR